MATLSHGSRTRRTLRTFLVAMVAATPLLFLPSASRAAPPLTIEQAKAQLAALEDKQAVAVESFDAGQITLATAQRSAATAQTSVTRQQAKVAAAQQRLSGLARMAYMGGGIDPVTGLLAGQGSSDVVERVGNLDQIARARSTQSLELRAQEADLIGLQRVQHDKLQAAQDAQRKLDEDRTSVTKLVSAQQSVLDHLQDQARKALLAEQAKERAAAAAAAAQAAAEAEAAIHAAAAAPTATALNTVAGGAAPVAGPSTQTIVAPVGPSSVAATVLAAAFSQRGKPYQWGGSGPNTYDCSGLVMWAFAHAGISMPHSAGAQYGYGTHVSLSQLQPGDIVFFDEGGIIGHDGIYVGGGMMIDANHTGGWVDVRVMGYYSGFIGGTRL